jgi:hypothetical protein
MHPIESHGVLIPALFSDLAGEAMKNIIKVLSELELIRKVYICLDRASLKIINGC